MVNNIKQTNTAGFSTLELLIAFAILSLSLTAIVMVAFGNQATAIDTELAQAGYNLAEQNLELSGISTLTDYNSVISDAGPQAVVGTPFSKQITVTDISPCSKHISSKVIWDRNGGRVPSTTLSSVFVNPAQAIALGANCSPVFPGSDWDTPETLGSLSSSYFNGQGTGISLTTINGDPYAIVTTNSGSSDNFYVIDISDPENVSAAHITSSENMSGSGLNGVSTAVIDGDTYAFVIPDDIVGQLQVINLNNPNNPILIATAARTLPNVTLGENPAPRTVYYYDEKVYIGTEYLAFAAPGFNHELHIYDVSTPTNPSWSASINVDRNVNDIVVNDDYAYLAHGEGSSPYTPFRTYDINPSSSDYLDEIGEFNTPLGRAGTAVFVLNDKAYLGTEKSSSGNDFYIIDITDPSNLTALSAYSLDGNISEVGDIVVQGPYAFIGKEGAGVHDTLQIWNVLDPTSAYRVNTCPNLLPPLPQSLSGLAYKDDYLFASYRSNKSFRILKDDPDVSCS